jgi:hypothetical protein
VLLIGYFTGKDGHSDSSIPYEPLDASQRNSKGMTLKSAEKWELKKQLSPDHVRTCAISGKDCARSHIVHFWMDLLAQQ